VIDRSAKRMEIALGAGVLDSPANGARQSDEEVTRTGEGHNLELHGLVDCHRDDECLLSLFGMARQRPVGKAPTGFFVDDAYDPARCGKSEEGHPYRHYDGRTSLYLLAFGEDPNAGETVRIPGSEALDCTLKGLMSVAEVGRVSVVVKAIGSTTGEGGPELVVGRLGVAEGIQQPPHGRGVRWVDELHDLLLAGPRSSRGLARVSVLARLCQINCACRANRVDDHDRFGIDQWFSPLVKHLRGSELIPWRGTRLTQQAIWR